MRLFYPMIAGFVVSKPCKMERSGVNVKFRPPPFIFGIVWPILYILLGLSWINSNPDKNMNLEVMFFVLSSLLAYWIVVYACQKIKKMRLCDVSNRIKYYILMVQIPKRVNYI